MLILVTSITGTVPGAGIDRKECLRPFEFASSDIRTVLITQFIRDENIPLAQLNCRVAMEISLRFYAPPGMIEFPCAMN